MGDTYRIRHSSTPRVQGVIAIGAIESAKAEFVADIVGSGLGVIGTLGGAFIGHRLGSSGRRETQQRLDTAEAGHELWLKGIGQRLDALEKK